MRCDLPPARSECLRDEYASCHDINDPFLKSRKPFANSLTGQVMTSVSDLSWDCARVVSPYDARNQLGSG
jgi:hypothetical protein